MKRAEPKLINYLLVAICIMTTGFLADNLGVYTKASGAITVLTMLLCGVGGINTFFYYLVVAAIEAVCFLVCSIIAKNFSYLLLPLIPLVFAIIVFVMQVIEFKIREGRE